MMKVIPLDKEIHLPIMADWWLRRSFPPALAEFTPPTGRIVTLFGEPIVGAFLHKSDSGAAVIGNLVADPDLTSLIRGQAIELLLITLISLAREEGFKLITVATNLPRLGERLKALGLELAEENMNHYGGLL